MGAALRASWPPGAAGYVLLALILIGAALRLIAIVSWWPTVTTLADSAQYAKYAGSNPFADPQHPAGYALILGGLGFVTREVAVPIVLQHLATFLSALLLFGATHRVTGSKWAGLLPAGVLMLNPDLILLEHSVMSEAWAILATSLGLYAAVRTFDQPEPLWRWPLLTGAALGLSVTLRSAGLLMIPIVLIAIYLGRPGSLRRWKDRWRGPVAAAGAAALVLLAFATANSTFGQHFGVGPSPGWYLYGRVAQFADCNRFTPPQGTRQLCEGRPAAKRQGARYYTFVPTAPAPRLFGAFGSRPLDEEGDHADQMLGEWSKRAVRAQPLDYLSTVWHYLSAYWVPSARLQERTFGGGLDPDLDFTTGIDVPYFIPIQSAIEGNMEVFFNPFSVHQRRHGLEFLRDLQHVTRFGATALTIATILTLLGLLIGPRRFRAGVLLFGVGGLALIVAPALTGTYSGRYTVPMAAPLMAAAAISILASWRKLAGRYAAKTSRGVPRRASS